MKVPRNSKNISYNEVILLTDRSISTIRKIALYVHCIKVMTAINWQSVKSAANIRILNIDYLALCHHTRQLQTIVFVMGGLQTFPGLGFSQGNTNVYIVYVYIVYKFVYIYI